MKEKEKKDRKPSWICQDLAWKIQTETHTQKLVLVFLAKSANDSLSCFHSYSSIRAHCGIASDTTVTNSIQYLRDDLHILTWNEGHKGVANSYTFDLDRMEAIIPSQGVFGSDNKRIKKTGTTPAIGVPTSPAIGVVDSSPASGVLQPMENPTPAIGVLTSPAIGVSSPASGEHLSSQWSPTLNELSFNSKKSTLIELSGGDTPEKESVVFSSDDSGTPDTQTPVNVLSAARIPNLPKELEGYVWNGKDYVCPEVSQ